jgi:phage shock protein PspC (stress-responsive transcriptional regulator)/predicted membrane protein
METQTPPPAPESGPRPTSEPFVRVREGRILGGVATGIARKFEVPLWVIRLAFVLTAVFGGLGFALYGIAWLAIKDEMESEPIATRLIRRIDGSTGWIGVALIGVAVLIVIDQIGFVRGDLAAAIVLGVLGVLLYRGELDFGSSAKSSEKTNETPSAQGATSSSATATSPEGTTMTVASPPAPPPAAKPATPPKQPKAPKPRPEPSMLGRLTFGIGAIILGAMGVIDSAVADVDFAFRHYVSAAMLIAGLGLLVGAVWGRARGLIALGVILTPIVFFSPIGDLDIVGTVGERRVNPDTVAEIPESIDMGIGSLRVDLSDVDFSGAEVSTIVDIGIGELVVYVPDDVTVDVEGDLGIGEIVVFGSTRNGVGLEIERRREGSNGFLDLNVDGGIGSIKVISRSGGDPNLELPRQLPGVSEIFEDSTLVRPLTLDPRYSLDDGDWFVDLTDTVVPDGGVETELNLDEGTMVISVPPNVTVAIRSEVGSGIMSIFGAERLGVGLSERIGNPDTADIVIDVEIESGILIITEETS